MRVGNDKIHFCGEKYSNNNAKYLCFSPLPIANGYESKCNTELFIKSKDGILELLQANTSSKSVGLVQMVILLCATLVLGGFYILFWMLINDWTAMFGILLPLIGLFYIMYFSVHDMLYESKSNIPIKFNFQRKEILISYIENPLVRPTFFGGVNNGKFDSGSNVRLFCLFAGAIIFPLGFFLLFSFDIKVLYFGFIATIIGMGLLFYACYPLVRYFLSLKNNVPKVKFLIRKWEDLNVNFVSYNSIATTTVRSYYALAFSVSLENTLNEKYIFTIPVWSKESALEIFSFVNHYMETGDSCDIKYFDKKEHLCLFEYEKKNDYLKNESFLYSLWKIWNVVTLRSFSCRLVDKINFPENNELEKHPEVVEWKKTLPENMWVTFSNELQEANKRVRALYAKGYRWESEKVRNVIREYDHVVMERALM